jgi:hypothetical protein
MGGRQTMRDESNAVNTRARTRGPTPSPRPRGRRRLACLLVISVVTIGCQKQDAAHGFETPAALATALAKAVTEQDRGRLRGLFPSDAVLEEALDCTGQENQLRRAQREREAFVRELDDDLANVTMQYVSTKQRKGKLIAKDTNQNGCRARIDMQWRRIRLKMQVTSEGQTDEVTEPVTMVRFGERGWFLVDH